MNLRAQPTHSHSHRCFRPVYGPSSSILNPMTRALAAVSSFCAVRFSGLQHLGSGAGSSSSAKILSISLSVSKPLACISSTCCCSSLHKRHRNLSLLWWHTLFPSHGTHLFRGLPWQHSALPPQREHKCFWYPCSQSRCGGFLSLALCFFSRQRSQVRNSRPVDDRPKPSSGARFVHPYGSRLQGFVSTDAREARNRSLSETFARERDTQERRRQRTKY